MTPRFPREKCAKSRRESEVGGQRAEVNPSAQTYRTPIPRFAARKCAESPASAEYRGRSTEYAVRSAKLGEPRGGATGSRSRCWQHRP
jgi:hypothetical protein